MANLAEMDERASIFKALSEPIRLRILGLLHDQPELCVCDLMAILESPQATISRHMTRLKTAGIVADRRNRMWVHYHLRKDMPSLAKTLLEALYNDMRQSEVHAKDVIKLRTHLKNKASC